MKDALGATQSVLVLGGSSDIAVATVRKLISNRTRNVVLAGRDLDKLKTAASELETADVTIEVASFDATAFDTHTQFVSDQFDAHCGFDLVLLAFAVLGNQANDETESASTVGVIETNFTGAASVLVPVAQRMRDQGYGTITVISTVAAERARAANFVYGSSKAGLDAFCQGLGDSLVGSGVSLMIVRPGFVKTKMTAGMDEKPMSTTAEAVADDITKGLSKGSEIIWSPAKLRWVFAIMRHLPRPVFRRVKQ